MSKMSKSDKMNLGLVPKLRFPEFAKSGEWEVTTLNILADRVTIRNNNSSINRVLTNSAVDGVVDQSDYFDREIANKNNLDNYFIINKNDYVYNPRISVTAPVGPISKNKIGTGVMSPLYTVFRFKNTNSNFYEQYFKTSHWHDYLKSVSNTGARHDRISISNDTFMNMPLPCLTDKEQEKISDCLSSLDDIISLEDKKHTSLKEHKKGLMQKLFPAEGKTVPELRFKEFQNSPNWETKKLGEVTYSVSQKNSEGRKYPIYSINNKEGFLPQSDQFDGLDSNSRGYDISLYKIVGKNTFAYNPARINVGSIGYSGELFDIIISSLYVCLKMNEEVNDNFFQCFLATSTFNNQVCENSEGGIRSYLFYENFSKIIVQFPEINEQEKIAECLTSLDNLIKTQAEKIITLKIHKKYLMQNLFPAMSEVN